MATVITSTTSSAMDTIPNETPSTIRTSTITSSGTSAKPKADDASDISAGSMVFGRSPSVYSKTEEKHIFIRVSYFLGLPTAFRDSLPLLSIPLSDFVETDNTTGKARVKDKWLSIVVLPRVLKQVEEFTCEWEISPTVYESFKATFDCHDRTEQYNAILSFLRFYGPDETSPERSFLNMREEIVEFSKSSCDQLHWRVFFLKDLAATLRNAFRTSPLLVNEINLYRLSSTTSLSGLVADIGSAVDANLGSMNLGTPTKDLAPMMDKADEEAVLAKEAILEDVNAPNDEKEAVLEDAPRADVTPSVPDTTPPVGILLRNSSGEGFVSPLTAVRTTLKSGRSLRRVRSTASRMTDGIRKFGSRVFAEMTDDPPSPADASMTNDVDAPVRTGKRHTDAPPIGITDHVNQGLPHDAGAPSVASIRRAEELAAAVDDDDRASRTVSFRGIPVDVSPERARSLQSNDHSRCSRHSSSIPLNGGSPGGNGGHGGGGGGGGGHDDNYDHDGADDDDDDDDDDHGADGYDRLSGNMNDAGWDSYDRDSFRYNRRNPADVRAAYANRPPTMEPDWRQIQLKVDDIVYDVSTNQVFAWHAYHDIYGQVMCFPARIGMKCINDDLFLASLRVGQPFDSTSQKLFARHFPTYNQGTPLLTYLSRIVDHAMQYRFFVPPLQKLRPDALLGDWKEGDLPPWVELSARTTMPGILAGCLRSKTANLIMDPSYSAIVRSNENGYESFRSLASLAGHPRLNAFADPVTPPTQRADCDVVQHLCDWKQYLDRIAMGGVFLSDRYFIDSFLYSLHQTVRGFFLSHLNAATNSVPRERALPEAFSPQGLTSYLLQYAIRMNCANYMTDSPRSLRTNSQQQIVRALQSELATPDTLVAALGSDRSCFLCGEHGHMFDDCPLLKKIKSNPFGHQRLLRALSGDAARARPPRRPPGPRTLPIAALEAPVGDYDADLDNLDDLSAATLDQALSDVPADADAGADDPDFCPARE